MPVIPAHERLIVALDVPDAAAARAMVVELSDSVVFYKIGLELAMGTGFFGLLDWLKAENKKVFVDLKFFDIPETVARAVKNLGDRGADFCTVHGNQAIMEAAAGERARTESAGGHRADQPRSRRPRRPRLQVRRRGARTVARAPRVPGALRWRRLVGAGGRAPAQGGAARIDRGDAGHPAGRQQDGLVRSEARDDAGEGDQGRRRLSRRRPADPRCEEPSRSGRCDPA